jgi:hypothetical protein
MVGVHGCMADAFLAAMCLGGIGSVIVPMAGGSVLNYEWEFCGEGESDAC